MSKRIIITDLDGTLYFQIPVQICMCIELCIYYVIHFNRIMELILLLKYRKQHNQDISLDLLDFASENKISVEKMSHLIETWLINRPLKWIRIFKDYKLIKLLNTLKKDVKIVVYSDYPTEQKLQALNFVSDEEFFYDNKEIIFMKPNSQGLDYIIKKLKVKKEEILVIGDREDKDGLAALKCGVDFIILSKNPIFRFFQIKKIKITV